MGAFFMNPIKALVNGATNGIKNGADEVIKNGAKNGAKNVIKNGKPPARILNKADYEGSNLWGMPTRDYEVALDQIEGKPKPQFRDQNGDLNYHQSNGYGRDKNGLPSKRESQFIHRDKKNGRTLARDKDAAFQTKPEVNKKKEFYKNREQELDSEVHHVAPIKSLKFLFDGLNDSDRIKLIEHFEKKGYYIGNDPRNGVGVTKEQHKEIHNVLYKKNGLMPTNRKSLKDFSLSQRLDFADSIMNEIDEAKTLINGLFYNGSEYSKGYQETFNV